LSNIYFVILAKIIAESFTCEAERVAAALVMKNQTLLHENKQLNELLREYEHTLEIVMTKFRGHSVRIYFHPHLFIPFTSVFLVCRSDS